MNQQHRFLNDTVSPDEAQATKSAKPIFPAAPFGLFSGKAETTFLNNLIYLIYENSNMDSQRFTELKKKFSHPSRNYRETRCKIFEVRMQSAIDSNRSKIGFRIQRSKYDSEINAYLRNHLRPQRRS